MNVYLPWKQLMSLRDCARRMMDAAYKWEDWPACEYWMKIHTKLDTKVAAWQGRPR